MGSKQDSLNNFGFEKKETQSTNESAVGTGASIKEQNLPTKENKYKLLVGHPEFRKYADGLKLNEKITYFYFVGTKDSSGISWCSDCNIAAPTVLAAWEKYKDDNSEFIMVDVGDRPTFKDKNCLFRIDKEIHITSIPTLIRWKTQRRLEELLLLKHDLLEMFFTEEE